MIVELILVLAVLFALLYGSYTDLKIREVPDWVSYGLILIGLLGRLLIGVVSGEWMNLGYSILWLILFVIIALIMFYTGQWGGADAKLLMGLGIVFASYPESLLNYLVNNFSITPNLTIPFPITLLFNIFFIGAIYGLAYSFILAFSNWSKFKIEFGKINSQFKMKRMILLFSLSFLILALASLFIDILLGLLFFVISFSLFLFVYLFLFSKSVEKTCMIKLTPVNKLTEGDWIVKNVNVKGKYICGPKDLGIEQKQIALLRKLKVKSVFVKNGIPFVPSFLISVIVSLIFGWFLIAF